MFRTGVVIAVVAGLALTACSDKDKDSESEGLRGAQPCLTTPSPIPESAVKFPTPFPAIDDVTWNGSVLAGPSRIVDGYTGDDLTDLYNEMKSKFAAGGYSVTKAEHDPHDAEVNFSSANNTGQVALSEECQGRTAVHITIRPK
jgi:hypothetical protein